MADLGPALWPILVLAIVAGLSDMLGGWLALRKEHFDDPRYIVALASGIVVSAVFFELMPESVEGITGDGLRFQMLIMALGFFSFYCIEKVLMLHACGEPECEEHAYSPTMVAGMAADNIVDGIGIAAGFLISPLVGITITVVVVAHEIPQGITSAELLKHANWPRKRIVVFIAAAGAMYVVGALLTSVISPEFYQGALAFVTGTFIYIGAADLMAEAHRKFNWRVIVIVLSGAVFMALLASVEGFVG